MIPVNYYAVFGTVIGFTMIILLCGCLKRVMSFIKGFEVI